MVPEVAGSDPVDRPISLFLMAPSIAGGRICGAFFMTAFWLEPDFDAHERVELFHDRASGLTAIIALHSTHLGPGAGGTRFWHYADPASGLRDALRLSRGMSYKNAMAGLPLGGGKAVILAGADGVKTPDMLAAFGDAVEALGGKYLTAEDVGISEADMVAVSKRTAYVSGLPASGDDAGGNPGPFTAYGIYLGIKAAVLHKLGKDSLAGVHIAIQGTGSVGGGVARLAAKDGAKLTLSDVREDMARALAAELGGEFAAPDAILSCGCDVLSPNALGAILDESTIPSINAPIIAGGANNQLATAECGAMLAERGITYAPDYVINAGGIISVGVEYLARTSGARADVAEVNARIEQIPTRLANIWRESDETGVSSDVIADRTAQKLIGR